MTLLGIINATADLVPVRRSSKADDFITLCPDCTEPHQLGTRYVCEVEGHGPYARNEVRVGKQLPDKRVVRVTDDEVAGAKGITIDKGAISLAAYNAKGVEAFTRPGEAAFRLRPKKASEVYDLLREIAADRNIALVGELATGDTTQKLYRVELWNGQLVLQELLRPDDVAPADEISHATTGNPRALELARELLQTSVQDFDPVAHRNLTRERLEALTAAKANDPDATVPVTPAAAPVVPATDLVALLEASLADKKPKAKAKRAPAKRTRKAA